MPDGRFGRFPVCSIIVEALAERADTPRRREKSARQKFKRRGLTFLIATGATPQANYLVRFIPYGFAGSAVAAGFTGSAVAAFALGALNSTVTD